MNELDISGMSNSVQLDIDNGLDDVTAFADAMQIFVEGKPMWVAQIQSLWTPTSGEFSDDVFGDLESDSWRLGVYPPAIVDGITGFEGFGMVQAHAPRSARSEAVAQTNTVKGSGNLFLSHVAERDAAISSTVTGTAIEVGATSATQKMVSVVRLLAAPGGAGSNDCDITIESDTTGFPSATTRITHTTIDQTSVALKEVLEDNGAVTDTFWRSVVTISGAGSRTFNLLIALGIADI